MSHSPLPWGDWRWRPRGLRPLAGVEILPGGKVIGDVRLAATAEDVVLTNVQFLHGEADPQNHWVLRQRRWRRPRRLSGTALLLAVAAGHNFYHWLIESLPRLRVAREAGWPVERFDHVLVNGKLQPFHRATLTRMGIRPEQIHPCSKRAVHQVERLVVPPVPGPPGDPEPWVADFLRQHLGSGSRPSGGRRLFLSRAGASRRRLLNETETLAGLEPLEFEVLHPEALSFADQAAAFAGADCLVGVHGSVFANLAFAAPGTVVVELMPDSNENPCFVHLARQGKLRFYRLPGRTSGPTNIPPEHRDLRVDPASLRRLLEQVQVMPA